MISRYGRPVELGVSLVPEWANLELLRSVAVRADELGLDLIGIQDHPYQWRFVDTWTLIADLLWFSLSELATQSDQILLAVAGTALNVAAMIVAGTSNRGRHAAAALIVLIAERAALAAVSLLA